MNIGDDPRGILLKGEASFTFEVEKLRAQVQDMQLEIYIQKETVEALKKDPGADLTTLRNRRRQ